MILRVSAFLITCAAFFGGGCAAQPTAQSAQQAGFDAKNYPKVAVSVSTPRNLQGADWVNAAGLSGDLENVIQAGLLKNGFEVAERSEVERVLKEIRFQGESGMTMEQQAKLGEAIGCRGMVILSLNTLDRRYVSGNNGSPGGYVYEASMSAKLVDLKKCTTVWTASVSNSRRQNSFFALDASSPGEALEGCVTAISDKLPSLIERRDVVAGTAAKK